MATASKTRKPLVEKEEQPKPLLATLTEKAVMAALGKPHDLHSVAVHRYTARHCRVNIRRNLTKDEAAKHLAKVDRIEREKMLNNIDHSMSGVLTIITDSFYLRTNYDGSLCSGQIIERKYNG